MNVVLLIAYCMLGAMFVAVVAIVVLHVINAASRAEDEHARAASEVKR